MRGTATLQQVVLGGTNYMSPVFIAIFLIIFLIVSLLFVASIRSGRNKPSESDFDVDTDWHE